MRTFKRNSYLLEMKQLTKNYEIDDFLKRKLKPDGKIISENSIKELLENGGKIEVRGKEYKASLVIANNTHVLFTSTREFDDGDIYTSTREFDDEKRTSSKPIRSKFLVRTFKVPTKFPVKPYGEFSYREKRKDSLFNQGYVLYANRELFSFSLRKCVAEDKSACNLMFFEELEKSDTPLPLEDIVDCLLRYSEQLGAEILRVPDFLLDLKHQNYYNVSEEYMIGESSIYL